MVVLLPRFFRAATTWRTPRTAPLLLRDLQRRNAFVPVSPPYQSASRRGARTKATLHFADLPQGVLPSTPLPSLEEDSAPAYPPVIQQHLNHVKQFSDCVVLTRVGNFYELYAEQAEQFGPLLNLKVAQRRTSMGPVAMSGFQFIYLDRYLRILVQDLNLQVAISEEIRNPEVDQIRTGGLLYTRKIARIITAGTLIDENFMDPYENNFLLCLHMDLATSVPVSPTASSAGLHVQGSTAVGLAWVDLSSGDFFTQKTDLASLGSLIARIGAKEVVLSSSLSHFDQSQISTLIGDGSRTVTFHSLDTVSPSIELWSPLLESPVREEERNQFSSHEVVAGSLLLSYISGKLLGLNISLRCPVRRKETEQMSIDRHTLRGLEIRTTLREGLFQGSLLHSIRRTVTKSGTRLLTQRLVSPSMSLDVINDRLALVEILLDESLRSEIMSLLRRSSDTLRLLQRFSIGKGDADDLLALARTMEVTSDISAALEKHQAFSRESPRSGAADRDSNDLGALSTLRKRLDLVGPSRLAMLINRAIDEDGLSQQHLIEEAEIAGLGRLTDAQESGYEQSSASSGKALDKASAHSLKTAEDLGEVWVMRRSASTTLKRAHLDLDSLVKEKQSLTTSLRAQLGSNSLTLKWTPQLSHFCHVKGKDAREMPTGARSISSTKSTRTFYLSGWTKLGSRLDDAKLRIRTEEQRVFNGLRKEVIQNLVKLRRNAAVLDELDVACSSAVLAEERNLIKPIIHAGATHNIIAGRHPMVDVGLEEHGRLFTANDCTMGEEEKILLITGPNMAGKSTYLRQNALISILAQTGCFVPAAYAEIGLVDKIFSRIGSADNVYNHQSTFMVEMLEVAEILNQATDRSFVLMDEVGRGTTPEDGVAVGYACLYYLHYKIRCRTLFATHFHALVDMTADFKELSRWCTAVAEHPDGSWVYVHKLRRGVNRDSHALKVAKLAGLPEEAIAIAADVISDLKQADRSNTVSQTEFPRNP